MLGEYPCPVGSKLRDNFQMGFLYFLHEKRDLLVVNDGRC